MPEKKRRGPGRPPKKKSEETVTAQDENQKDQMPPSQHIPPEIKRKKDYPQRPLPRERIAAHRRIERITPRTDMTPDFEEAERELIKRLQGVLREQDVKRDGFELHRWPDKSLVFTRGGNLSKIYARFSPRPGAVPPWYWDNISSELRPYLVRHDAIRR